MKRWQQAQGSPQGVIFLQPQRLGGHRRSSSLFSRSLYPEVVGIFFLPTAGEVEEFAHPKGSGPGIKCIFTPLRTK